MTTPVQSEATSRVELVLVPAARSDVTPWVASGGLSEGDAAYQRASLLLAELDHEPMPISAPRFNHLLTWAAGVLRAIRETAASYGHEPGDLAASGICRVADLLDALGTRLLPFSSTGVWESDRLRLAFAERARRAFCSALEWYERVPGTSALASRAQAQVASYGAAFAASCLAFPWTAGSAD